MAARRILLCAALLMQVGIGLGWRATTAAQKPDPSSRSQAMTDGATSYREHCAVCHGDQGRGNGPAAAALKPRPTDLTRLTLRTGTFPESRLTGILKGTEAVSAHGTPAMMIWGTMFVAEANGNSGAAEVRVRGLVAFIASLQESR